MDETFAVNISKIGYDVNLIF